MNRWLKTLEKVFAAASFAEAGEHETAREIAGIIPRPAKDTLNAWDRTFAAASFAEAGYPEVAMEMLEGKAPRKKDNSLESFLNTVGLSGTRFSYGLARI